MLEAGSGHRAEYAITAADLDREAGAARAAPSRSVHPPESEHPAPGSKPASPSPAARPATKTVSVPRGAPHTAVRGLNPRQVELIVERALEAKLAPLKAQLARLAAKDKTSYQDVIAGLGWIMGLLGIAAWFKSRPGPKAKPHDQKA